MSNEAVIAPIKEKIDDLNQQAWEARVNDSPKAFELSQESVKLSREINYPKGLAEGLRSLGFCYVRLFKNDEAAPLLKESLSLFQSLNDLRGQAVIYEYLGIIERNWGNLGHSLELLLKGNKLVQQVGPIEVEVTSCYQIGVTYKHLGDHENALDYLYRSLSLAEKINLTLMVAYSTNIIGSIYFDNGNYEKALELYQQGLIIRRQSNDKWGEAGSLDNIGFTYLKLNELDKAIDHCKQSLAICQSTGDKKGEANALLHLAEIYEQANDVQNASKFSNESLSIRKARGDKRGEAEVLLFLAGLHKNNKDARDQQVFEWLSGALNIANEIKAQDLLSKSYYSLHEYYDQIGDYKNSLIQLEAHLQIEKELHKNLINQKVSNLEITHKAETISQRNKELTELNEQIEKANAELKIEAALERIRARAMAMHSSNEIMDVANILREQMGLLGQPELETSVINIVDETSGQIFAWHAFRQPGLTSGQIITGMASFFQHTSELGREMFSMLRSGKKEFTIEAGGQKLKEFTQVLIDADPQIANYIGNVFPEKVYYYFTTFKGGTILTVSYQPPTDDIKSLQKKAASVFDMAYRRYLDLKKAEEQAREAQIELGLERVRAKAMAMQEPTEFVDVINVIGEQFIHLGFDIEWVNFGANGSDISNGIDTWNFAIIPGGDSVSSRLFIPYFDHPLFSDAAAHLENYQRTGNDLFEISFDKKEKDRWLDHLFTNTIFKDVPNEYRAIQYAKPGYTTSNLALKDTFLSIGKFDTSPFTDEQHTIFRRFGKAFGQAYTRFLDLQKAEAQAREAQIETGLERVRSKTMAMHKSEEVTGVAVSLNEELLKLGFQGGSTIIIINNETGDTDQWTGFSEDKSIKNCYVPYFKHPYHDALLDAWKNDKKFLVYTVAGEEKKPLDDHYFSTGYKIFPENDKKWMREMKSVTFSHAFMKYGAIHWGPDHLTEEQLKILQRFSKVFEQSYTRFLDLQKAEAQAREAEIQLALERVRAKSLAMHHTSELQEVVDIVAQQLHHIGMDINGGVAITINDEVNENIPLWASSGAADYMQKVVVPLFDRPILTDLSDAIKKRNTFFVREYSNKEKIEFFEHLFRYVPWNSNSEERKKELLSREGGLARSAVISQYTSIVITNHNGKKFSDEDSEILKRFGNVFEQSYIRFLDLQKAEAQAREAKIEAALERVRSKAMAMQNSAHLNALISHLFEESTKLDLVLDRCIVTLVDPQTLDTTWILSNPETPTEPTSHLVKYHEHKPYLLLLDAWKNRTEKLEYILEGEEKKSWDRFLFYQTELSNLPAPAKEAMQAFSSVRLNSSSSNFGNITLASFEPLNEAQFDILIRFTKVFDLTYTRYNDLKQAEAQARESQIEAALERVRSRSMAMHKSDELREVVAVLFTQLQQIGFDIKFCSIALIDKINSSIEFWLSGFGQEILPESYHVPKLDHPFYRNFHDTFREGVPYKVFKLSGEEKRSYDELWFVLTDFRNLPEPVKKPMMAMDSLIMSCAFTANGMIQVGGFQPLSEADALLIQRFAKVFEQTYTRFLDLQKAEAQARDAQIEAALERVRSKTMAMQKSEELDSVIKTVYSELKQLDVSFYRCFIMIFDEQKGATWWMGSPDGNLFHKGFYVQYHTHQPHSAYLKGWEERLPKWEYLLEGQIKKDWDDFVFSKTELSKMPLPVIQDMKSFDHAYLAASFESFGCMTTGGLERLNEESFTILNRFTKVFDQTYRRFLDLQNAEAQARDAQIEAALERVRAKVMSMTNSKDLDDTSLVFGEQLRKLGINWQFSYFWLIEEEKNKNTFWITWPDNKTSITEYTLEEAEQYFNECLISWRAGIKIHDNYVPPIDAQAWLDTFQRIADDAGGVAKQIMTFQTFSNGVFYYDAMMKYGSFGICINKPATDEEKNIQCRFAIEFERAYTRFLDLKKAEAQAEQARLDLIQIQHEKKRAEEALAELQATQKQLIQTEKMASLGELTAGIAHEIQNPLNFVNNFSDVSNELIEEMKEELKSGNTEQAMQIVNDVKDNLEKILHHGKRADAIVKGMLQHSRSSSGVKEPTDINNLADEYLRLAFHGYRAKDKSFNAKFETNFDNSIEKINVIPQDIGRVILNLINNAFYTVNEKRKQVSNGYEPTVTVTTKKIDDRVEISVKDNGNGIPQKMLDKIFQPFFTTKPTGQGTGLGLSLSYDIITKGHDGEINVKTNEGKGAEFIISLPVN